MVGTRSIGGCSWLGSILRRPASGIGACDRASSTRTASIRSALLSVTMSVSQPHVRNRSSAPHRCRSRTYEARHEHLEHHRSTPTYRGLPVRARRRSAPSAKKSHSKPKNACFDRSETSPFRRSYLFKARFSDLRRAKSSKGKD